mmetsp:Transcript_5887/g.15010  ORF Transcript_5887/g.15010 Transcript_5887/m.15010 type:complete len:372 (-) Transcript_5887:6-1121(-)
MKQQQQQQRSPLLLFLILALLTCTLLPTALSTQLTASVLDDLFATVAPPTEAIRALTRSSRCWEDAVHSLSAPSSSSSSSSNDASAHTLCEISGVASKRFALDLTNCHLVESGRTAYACSRFEEVRSCLSTLPAPVFAIYSEFLLHQQTVCLFVNKQLLQRSLENAVHELRTHSEQVSQNLEQFHSAVRESTALAREQLLDMQVQMAQIGDHARDTITGMLDSFASLREAVERALAISDYLFADLTSLKRAVQYALLAFGVFLLTSTDNTKAARVWLFVALVLSLGSELLLMRYKPLLCHSIALLQHTRLCGVGVELVAIRAALLCALPICLTLSITTYRHPMHRRMDALHDGQMVILRSIQQQQAFVSKV